jgi:riboflavin synthase
MYGGIIHDTYPVVAIDKKTGLTSFTLQLDEQLLADVQIGASVSVDGVCLTVTWAEGDKVRFDVMGKTLEITTLGSLELGSKVNVERSLKQGDEVGGHPISGHIDGMAEIVRIETPENNKAVTFALPEHTVPYVFLRGFLALDGCSLTAADVDKAAGTATVHLIPETLRRTTFGFKEVGDFINVEVDRNTQVIVDTVRAVLADMAGQADGGQSLQALASLAGGGMKKSDEPWSV